MKNRKIISFFIAVLMILSALTVGCANKDSKTDTTTANDLIFNEIESVSLYEEIEFDVFKGVQLNQVEFESSNPKVAIVEGNRLFALQIGKTTITAKYGNGIQKQTIEVIDNGNRPQINVQDLGLINGTSFTLSHKVGWGEKFFDGATFTYSSENSNVIEIDGNIATAKEIGVAKINVSSIYKGKVIATSDFNCRVNANEGIVLDRSSYDLFITEQVKGVEFEKQVELSARVYENGQIVHGAPIEFEIENTNVAEIENGFIKAKSLGVTYLVATYENDGKVLTTKNIPISVSVSVIKDNTDVIIDKGQAYQLLDNAKIFGTNDKVGKLVNNENGFEINVNSNGVNTNLFTVGEYSFTVYNEKNTIGNIVNLVVAEYVVYDKNDLLNISSDQNINKYIAIAKDIDFEGGIYTNAHSNPGSSVSAFTGTLNGLGHTIKNISFVYASEGYKGQNYLGYSGGLFSYAGDCTFKNLCMDNVELFGWNSAPLFYRSSGIVTIDNVYISSTFTNTAMNSAGGLFAFCFNGQVSVSNSIIISNNLTLNDSVKLNNGAICGRLNGVLSVNNAYVISDGDICSTQSDYHNRPESANSLSILYADFEEFETEKANGNVNTSDFNHYWDLTKDVPTFKTNVKNGATTD